MNSLTAFRKLWECEISAERAAWLLSYALVVQLVGWEGLRLNADRVHDLRRVLERAGIDPIAVRFFSDADPTWVDRRRLTDAEIEALRSEQEREFGTLAYNMRGHLYKKTEWRDRRNVATEMSSDDEE